MTTMPLTRPEASFLHAAAADQGRLQFAATMKPASRQRLTGRFLRDGLITPPEAPDGPHRMTPAGYRAIGLTPPKAKRRRKAAPEAEAHPVASATSPTNYSDPDVPAGEAPSSKKAQVLLLLERREGATLAELMAATGWLPHTVRAALSRIRSAGQPLLRTARTDAAMAYRVATATPGPAARPRRSRPTWVAAAPTGDRTDATAQAAV